MATYLDEILAHHRLQPPMTPGERESLAEAAAACTPTRGFLDTLRRGSELQAVAVIAEIKRRSPSKGDLSPALDPIMLARAYENGGASCLSVLTDSQFFGGDVNDLVDARGNTALPVLRKDFVVSERDVYETRLMGADAMLLIVAALSDAELGHFHRIGIEIGLDILVEVHDEAELKRALRAGARVIGVNQRDLHTFEVDPDRANRVGSRIPDGIFRVAESGVSNVGDVGRLVSAGFHAVLVGEAFVCSDDPTSLLQAFISGATSSRGSSG